MSGDFTINELKDMFEYAEARRIAAKLTRYGLARSMSQRYVPYMEGERIGHFSVFNIDDCISFYNEKMSLPNREHVFTGMVATMSQLKKIDGFLNG